MQTFIPNQAIEKKCHRCHLVKSIDCFYNDKNSKDGRTSHCKICNDEASKKRQERLHPKKALTDYKVCASCGENKQIKEFVYHKWSTGSRGGSRICRSCYIIKTHKPIPVQKTCAVCGETKPFKEFLYVKNSSGIRGGSKICYSCTLSLRREHYKDNANLLKYQKYYNRHTHQLKRMQIKLKVLSECLPSLHGYSRKMMKRKHKLASDRLNKLSALIITDLDNIHRLQVENIINPNLNK
jgi:hypothetical protein